MNKRFWKDKNVLITGFEGFLGSNLTKYLLSLDSNVIGLDIRTGRNDTILDKADYRKMTLVRGTVCDYDTVRNILKKHNIEIVFHLAAEAIVAECLKQPLCAFSSNIQGTWNVLEACRDSGSIQSIVIASSDKAYGSHKKLPYKENASLIGNHPYDVSKSCADLIANTYFHTYNLPVAVTRCGNIYGPGDFNFSRIVIDSIRCALKGKSLAIRSDGKFTRDYVFVKDIISGYVLLAEKLQKLNLGGEAFNFSYGNPITVIELVKKIYRLLGREPQFTILNQAKYEIKDQYLDSRKAKRVLGWKPMFTLEEGLGITIDWHKKFLK